MLAKRSKVYYNEWLQPRCDKKDVNKAHCWTKRICNFSTTKIHILFLFTLLDYIRDLFKGKEGPKKGQSIRGVSMFITVFFFFLFFP
jgi:hypothetical protein